MSLKERWREAREALRDAAVELERHLPFKREKPEPAPERIARQWGRLTPLAVVRYVPKAPVFVHCHECRWPVNPGRTHMLLGNDQRTEATEEQMQRVCEGVRRQMGLT